MVAPSRPTLVLMPAAAPSVNLSAVRAWARENGLKVADRGRLPAGLVEQFLKANPQAAGTGEQKSGGNATSRPAASRSKAPGTGTRNAAAKPVSSRAPVTSTEPGPARSAARTPAAQTKADAPVVMAKDEADEVLLDDEQVELLQDLPVVLEELNAELDAVQQALKDLQAENAQLKQRLDRLESKRGLFARK
ncbi:MAG: Lsr2 [Frankiales bacterium]|nr:Lsr2 [Frankiales bacterium]